MAADVVVKMKANVKEYDGGLAKAKKGLDEFVKSNTSLNGLLAQGATQLTKFAGGFAAAQLAMKGFNAVVMDGSQTTGDFVRNGLGAMQDTLGVLASSIATMDFSVLIGGLGDVYKHALAARESLDSLNDTLRGLGLAGDEARQAVAELQEVNKNAASTSEEQAAALKKAQDAVEDYKETIQTAIKETNDWVDENMKAQSGFGYIKTTADDVKKLTIEYAKMDKAAKDAYKARVKAAQAGYAEAKNALDVAKNGEKRWVSSYTGVGGGGHFETTPKGTDKEIAAARQAVQDYETANKGLLQAYMLFERNSDAEMNDIAQKVRDIAGYSTQAAQMQRRLDQAMNTTATSGASVSAPKASGGKASGASYQSQLEMPDYQRSMKELAMGIPSMKELTDYASKLKTEMSETTSTVNFNKLAAEYAAVQEAIEAQPLAISAGISINEAEHRQSIEEQWAALRESLHLEMEADVKLNTAQISEAASGMTKDAKKTQATWNAVAQSVSNVGAALRNTGNEGLDIAGMVMEAVADVALGFAMALKSPTAAALGPWAWIAAATAGAATMVATIASIKSATSGGYASGGVVPGAYNGGMDSTYVYASPGELILNRAQQENLLGQLDEGVSRGGVVRSITTGEQLITVINNTGRRRGKGELLFG